MKKWFAVLLVILSLTTVSCKTVLDWSEKESTVMELGGVSVTDCEVRFVALHYKCLYETYYVSLLTENFWDQKVDEGATFEDFVKQDSVRNELS